MATKNKATGGRKRAASPSKRKTKPTAPKTKAALLKELKAAQARIAKLEEEVQTFPGEEVDPDSERNITWQRNHQKILAAYRDLIKDGTPKPTLQMIAKASKVSIRTAWQHFQEIKFDAQSHPMRILTDDVVYEAYVTATDRAGKNRTAAHKFWFELMEGHSTKIRHADSEGGDLLGGLMILPNNNRDSKT